jgi:hypothetical protein
MPKHSYRCNRRTQGISHAPSSVAFMAPPRKVSFEDGTMSESETADLSPVLRVLTDEPAPLTRQRLTLVRPKSSRSLVDLAKSVDEDDESGSSFYNYQQTSGETTTSGGSAVPVSPVNHLQQSPSQGGDSSPSQGGDSSPSTPSSPWGQFVDMIIPPHLDNESRAPMLHHYPDAPCSCCPSCRRRRGNPYGDYTKKNKISKHSLDHKGLLLLGTSTSRPLPTDQLVGALRRLQV